MSFYCPCRHSSPRQAAICAVSTHLPWTCRLNRFSPVCIQALLYTIAHKKTIPVPKFLLAGLRFAEWESKRFSCPMLLNFQAGDIQCLRPENGRAFGAKSKPRHRGIKTGISLHAPDHWVRACPVVEMMGVEPMSENPLTKPSSWTVCYFRFPFGSVNRHTLRPGSPFMPDRFKSEPPVQVHCLFDAQSAVAVLRRGTGDPQVTALPSFTPKRKTQAAIATVSLSFIF